MSEDKEETHDYDILGSTITLKESEAALVVYVDEKHRGKKVSIYCSDANFRATVQIMNRAGVCAALFPRIPLKGKQSATAEYNVWLFYDLNYDIPSRTGEDVEGLSNKGFITLFAGYPAEVDLTE